MNMAHEETENVGNFQRVCGRGVEQRGQSHSLEAPAENVVRIN
jgi:hypothetical protein